MIASPVTDSCKRAYATKAHAVLGISPFNSYFSEDRIRRIAEWGIATFNAIHLFVPDKPSAYTLEALGYPPAQAARKARRQAKYLHNKIRRALGALDTSPGDIDEMILNSERLDKNPRYCSKLEECRQLFDQDPGFRKGCLASSYWVLENQANAKTLGHDSLRIAANYLLAEMPLFVDSVGILEQEASVFCYHECIPFLQDLFRGRYQLRVSANQGFTVLPTLDIKLTA